MDITEVLSTGGVAAKVIGITGDTAAAASAAGWSAWILSISGRAPTVRELPDKRVSIELDQEQTKALRRYLDTQVHSAINDPAKGPVELNLGKSIGPWAMQYAVPLLLVAFVAGWYGHSLTKGRRR